MNTPQAAKINIINVIKEAWTLIPGTRWPIYSRMLIATIFSIVFTWIVFGLSQNLSPGFSATKQLLQSVILIVVNAYIYATIMIPAFMVGIRRALGLPFNIKMIKEECLNSRSKLAGLILLLVLFSFLFWMSGFAMINPPWVKTICVYIIGIIYLYLTIPIVSFALPLIILNKQNVKSALSSAYINMRIYWKEVLGVNIILLGIPWIIIYAISYFYFHYLSQSQQDLNLPYWIAVCAVYFWLLPWQFIANGIFFRKIYDESV